MKELSGCSQEGIRQLSTVKASEDPLGSDPLPGENPEELPQGSDPKDFTGVAALAHVAPDWEMDGALAFTLRPFLCLQDGADLSPENRVGPASAPTAPCLLFPWCTQGQLWGRKQISSTVHTCMSHQVSGFAGNTALSVGLSLLGALQTLLTPGIT